jgi:hypothetical protein
MTTTVTAGKTFVSGETVTPDKLNALGLPTVSSVLDADEVIAEKLASDSVTTAKILNENVTAGKLAASLDLSAKTLVLPPAIISGQTAITATEDTDYFLIWDATDSGLKKVSRASLVSAFQPVGSVVQTVQKAYATYTTYTNKLIAVANTPTVSDGSEIISQAITLAASENKVLCSVNVPCLITSNANTAVVALFRGSTCISSTLIGADAATYVRGATINFLDTPGGNATYTVRVGTSANCVLSINGYVSKYFGDTLFATLTLQEIKG